MDRDDLEPGYRMLKKERWLQKLLRRTACAAVAGSGIAALCEWLRRETSRRRIGNAATMEKAPRHLRQFNERPLPRGCSAGIHPASIWDNGEVPATHVSDPDEAK